MKKIVYIIVIATFLGMVTQCASEIYTHRAKRNLIEHYMEYLDSAFKAQIKQLEKSELK